LPNCALCFAQAHLATLPHRFAKLPNDAPMAIWQIEPPIMIGALCDKMAGKRYPLERKLDRLLKTKEPVFLARLTLLPYSSRIFDQQAKPLLNRKTEKLATGVCRWRTSGRDPISNSPSLRLRSDATY
jgi:hypothetical protein